MLQECVVLQHYAALAFYLRACVPLPCLLCVMRAVADAVRGDATLLASLASARSGSGSM